MRVLTEPSDPAFDDYRNLTDAAARRRHDEHGRGSFIVEGAIALSQLVASGRPIRSILVTPNRLDVLDRLDLPTSTLVLVAERPLLAGVAGYDVHRGVLAAGRRSAELSPETVLGAGDTTILAEAITDAENVGALFRNVAAFDLGGVVLDRRCADPLYRRAIRVSSGWTLRVPYSTVEDLAPVMDALAPTRRLVALSPDRHAVALDEALDDGLFDGPVALAVGTEGSGLADATLDRADAVVRIPMAAEVDSLNVATTVAILGAALDLHRRRKQRLRAP